MFRVVRDERVLVYVYMNYVIIIYIYIYIYIYIHVYNNIYYVCVSVAEEKRGLQLVFHVPTCILLLTNQSSFNQFVLVLHVLSTHHILRAYKLFKTIRLKMSELALCYMYM